MVGGDPPSDDCGGCSSLTLLVPSGSNVAPQAFMLSINQSAEPVTVAHGESPQAR